MHLVRLGLSSDPEQEAFYSIDHGESTHCKLVQRFMQGRKHTKASHYMRHQPELMAGVKPGALPLFLQRYAERKNNDPDYHILTTKASFEDPELGRT